LNIFGWDISRKGHSQGTVDDVLGRLRAIYSGNVNDVTPDNCMKSPTVNAIVTAISRRISVSPVHVYEKTTSRGRDAKEKLPSHPVAKLLNRPNSWQTRTEYWLDAASTFVRHGRFFAYKSRGTTGPVMELIPIHPQNCQPHQDNKTWAVHFKVTVDGGQRDYEQKKIHYVRGPARDFLCGNSPVEDVKLSIALEIAAEEFGATFFQNGALPLMILQYMAGSAGFKTEEQEKRFIQDFQNAFGGSNRHKALLLPKGIDQGKPISVENDKAQMIETRKYQRTVIAGAFGVPPHLVGDLERATFNNVEQQDIDFTSNVVQPVATAFESAMERDLLTDEDRAAGRVIRFNLDSILRSDFKSRQEGLQIQRLNGAIDGDEWREIEGRNPLKSGKGGDEVWRPANMTLSGTPIEKPKEPGKPNAETESTPRDQEPK
jgi:HK97 family phage portal protein